MGYGAGHELTLNPDNGGYVKYNGKDLRVQKDYSFFSWDFTHPMDGMTNIKMDLLKIKFHPIELNSDDRAYLKEYGYKRWDELYFSWEFLYCPLLLE